MSLIGALFAGASGLNSNSQALNVLGDNISNLNTIGFKGSQGQIGRFGAIKTMADGEACSIHNERFARLSLDGLGAYKGICGGPLGWINLDLLQGIGKWLELTVPFPARNGRRNHKR